MVRTLHMVTSGFSSESGRDNAVGVPVYLPTDPKSPDRFGTSIYISIYNPTFIN